MAANNAQHPNSVHLTVEDPKRSIRFYEKLGFALENTWPSAKAPLWANLLLGGQSIMIGAHPETDSGEAMGCTKAELRLMKKDRKAFKKHKHGIGVSIYLHVDDVDAHSRNAKRKKIEVLTAPQTRFYGIRDYLVTDPDGYRLVFYSPAPEPTSNGGARKSRPKKKRRTAATPTPAAPPSHVPSASDGISATVS